MLKLTVAFVWLCLPMLIAPSEAKKVCTYKGSQCPRYYLVSKTSKYQERMYNGSLWVSTSAQVSGPNVTRGISRLCYFRLRRYLRNSNITMGVPVTTTVQPHPKAAGKLKFTMSFFLPTSSPPSPRRRNSGVKIEYKQSLSVYVKVFKALPRGTRINLSHAKQLDHDLKADSLAGTYYTPDQMYMTAGYDPPWVRDRINEVWLVKNQWWGP